MSRNSYYIGIAFFGMINGLPFFSPVYLLTLRYSAQLMAAPLFGSLPLIAYFHSLMLSTTTIILAGIPAAIYERFVGAKDDSTDTSLWILAGRHGDPGDPRRRQFPEDRSLTSTRADLSKLEASASQNLQPARRSPALLAVLVALD